MRRMNVTPENPIPRRTRGVAAGVAVTVSPGSVATW